MASEKNLNEKKSIVKEITEKIKNAESVILFSYQGLTVDDLSQLRRKLKESNSEVKIYKNTLLKRALEDLKINLEGFMEGPNALLFGTDLLEPIKVISDFAKENDKLEIRVGIISGEVSELSVIKEYASIPSRDGLLTMLAGGMVQFVKDLSISLNLYADTLSTDKAQEEVKTEEVKVEETPDLTTEEPTQEANEEVTEEEPTEENSEEVVEETTEEESN